MSAADDAQAIITLLVSIDASLRALVGARGVATDTTSAPAADARCADDRDLDSQYGDEEVRFNPRDWTGPAMKGRRMSECPPDFLDMLAETLDYFARKNAGAGAMTTGGKPKADFDRRGAARARGWARRLRAGWKAPEMGSDSGGAPAFGEPAWMQGNGGGDDDLAF
jgi:hypothetical protein